MNRIILLTVVLFSNGFLQAQMDPNIQKTIDQIEDKVIAWRHDFHQNPELSNNEFRTAAKIAEHLTSLGLEVQTGVAKTGVVALLRGDHPGKVVALRADIDALPVT